MDQGFSVGVIVHYGSVLHGHHNRFPLSRIERKYIIDLNIKFLLPRVISVIFCQTFLRFRLYSAHFDDNGFELYSESQSSLTLKSIKNLAQLVACAVKSS